MTQATSNITYIHPELRSLAVPIDAIFVDPNNARQHSEKNIEAIRNSLGRFGQRVLLTVTPENIITKGNGTWLAAKQLGWKFIAVLQTDDDPITATKWALVDNRSAELGTWDEGVLLQQLQAAEVRQDLEATGFEENELETLMMFVAFDTDEEAVPTLEWEKPERARRIIIRYSTAEEGVALRSYLGLDPEQHDKITYSFGDIVLG